MKLRPILFSTAMVQAILDGRKTQTRRVVKVQPRDDNQRWQLSRMLESTSKSDKKNEGKLHWVVMENDYSIKEYDPRYFVCPYGQPGDILWVRETWAPALGDICYKADYSEETLADEENKGIWKPSIHMPFAAARIFLRIKSVRVERLQDISEADAVAEGTTPAKIQIVAALFQTTSARRCYRDGFKSIWQSINGAESWNANPWVWVVEFERISREEAGV